MVWGGEHGQRQNNKTKQKPSKDAVAVIQAKMLMTWTKVAAGEVKTSGRKKREVRVVNPLVCQEGEDKIKDDSQMSALGN